MGIGRSFVYYVANQQYYHMMDVNLDFWAHLIILEDLTEFRPLDSSLRMGGGITVKRYSAGIYKIEYSFKDASGICVALGHSE